MMLDVLAASSSAQLRAGHGRRRFPRDHGSLGPTLRSIAVTDYAIRMQGRELAERIPNGSRR